MAGKMTDIPNNTVKILSIFLILAAYSVPRRQLSGGLQASLINMEPD
jgi:hypothetical protein